MKVKTCPSCGHKHDSTDDFCPYCKHNYTDEKVICKNCGAYLKVTDKACYVCDELVEKDKPLENSQDTDLQNDLQTNEDNKQNEEVEYIKEDKKMKNKKGKVIALSIMIIALVAVVLGVLGFCIKKYQAEGSIGFTTVEDLDEKQSETSQSTNASDDTQATSTSADNNVDAQTDATVKNTGQEDSSNENSSYFKDKQSYFSVTIPDEWKDKYVVVEDDQSIQYYEKYNYEKYGCGKLLSVYIVDANDHNYDDYNSVKVEYSADGKAKVMVMIPTDVAFNYDDDKAMKNYVEMSDLIEQVVDSVKAK